MNSIRKPTRIAIVVGALAAMAGCLGPDQDQNTLASRESELSTKPIRFIGSSTDWFDPTNWQGGRVPGADDDVLIDGKAKVVIDPANNPDRSAKNPGTVTVRDVYVTEEARFETQPGSDFHFGAFDLQNQATFFAYSSAWQGNLMPCDKDGCYCPRWRCGYNPSYLDVDLYELNTGSLALYLGGTQPAAPGETGPGHYAAIRGGTISIADTELLVDFKYGFAPLPGDRFVIVKARDALEGTFSNLADGDEVLRTRDVRLVIAYERNQIELVAESL